ncbi:D-tagatose-bisphosphate aldolase, class II, non-catalytic subunit [Silvibacterium dinghuense]|uniref:D-tagatose-bisphosphate aldolase, class II, non-catalytic subunit n=1 Tax=Silvibacterium dinghuense TaxID=1560006 RepID=A0A4Q1SB98_9BACT|nr:D-tagatose-bisphosphate aldolase, class II, non-catalytic subunit [Silvibacterium dinghuense]RXS94277.1 D-tagatose-bisphosphate aldolase, class II, non-catalytic subunit [Silvibacterium dinghuense]GGH17240.1 D-tagatose-1,6-bisphosphate aldolase subunit KbaZ [Silvibacterium dinghuense]
MSQLLQQLLKERNEPGKARGIYSVCSAHPWVIRASMQQAIADGSPLLIEATSNQVNQDGGYTGMRPKDFRKLVEELAAEEGLALDRIILGGDHLGPNPWQNLPAEEAMRRAEAMVAEYAAAGFRKIHLDASMACADDVSPLPTAVVAERAARLCRAAEKAATGEKPGYIFGTEVPVPGGATESLNGLEVTRLKDAEETWRIHREVFHAHGLDDAWERMLGMVVQPGVEFNHDSVVNYDRAKAVTLTSLLDRAHGLVFEAHSTDYQRPDLYRALVEDGFAILKVGPALTFAMREALFALAAIEKELVPPEESSRLPEVMEEVMLAHPKNWSSHYHGNTKEQKLLRRYSYSDRIRYYWNDPDAERAVELLMRNLRAVTLPETLLSAYLPLEYREVRQGVLQAEPEAIVLRQIRRALEPYAAACFG